VTAAGGHGDGLVLRGYQLVGSGRHAKPGGELSKNPAICLCQLQQGIY
jgi:hypothetical protein